MNKIENKIENLKERPDNIEQDDVYNFPVKKFGGSTLGSDDPILSTPNECAIYIDKPYCLSDEIIIKAKNLYDIDENDPKKIIEEIKKETNCKTESCILNQSPIVDTVGKDRIELEKEERFKPFGPSTTTEWFSDSNILDVLKQWEKYYAFESLGYHMRDFMKLGTMQSAYQMAEKLRDRKSLAAIFNTDVSAGRGIHWFCVFIDPAGTIEYFNSSGSKPMSEFYEWILKTSDELSFILKKDFKVVLTNKERLQYDDHSCGPYSVFYIYFRLEGYKPQDLKSNLVNDDLMLKFRGKLFRKVD